MLLYNNPVSGNCYKVRLLFAHLEIPYERRELDVVDRSNRPEVLGALNPALRVPTIVLDDGRALAYQAQGTDLLLSGQTPLGEILATPSAPLVDGISACLVDCDDETRLERLHVRGAGWLERSGGTLDDQLSWAEWMRQHAADPSVRQEVIVADDGSAEMRWERWTDWTAGDPRWRVHVIDTTDLAVENVADELAAWIERERARQP